MQFVIFYVSALNSNRKTVVSELTNRMMWSSDLVFKDKEGNIKFGSTKETAVNIGRVVTMQKSSGATETDETVSIYLNLEAINLMWMYREMKNWFFSDKKRSKVCNK